MHTFSKLSSVILSAALCGSVTYAQTPDPSSATPPSTSMQARHHGPNAEHQTKFLTRKLGLTSDQTAQVRPILEERDQKMAALHASDSTLTVKQMHEQHKAIDADSQQKLNAVLNDTQRQQLAELKAEHRHHPRANEQETPTPTPAPTV